MDYQEMLLAAHVRTMAGEFYKAHYMAKANALRGDPNKEEKMVIWSEENPMAKFIESAYREVKATAKAISSLERAEVERVASGRFSPMPPPTSAGTETPSE